MAKLSIKEQNAIREGIYEKVLGIFPDAMRVSEGLVINVGDDENEQFVVIRAIVKDMQKFDIEDALMEYEDKLRKQAEREEEKARKEAERKAKAEEKKKAKEAKEKEEEKKRE